MPAGVAKEIICPFCGHVGRSDHIRRHLRTHATAILDAPEAHPAWTRLGQTKVFYTTTPGDTLPDGTQYLSDRHRTGVCLGCCCIINNSNTPTKLTAFERHVCKEKQVRERKPKSPSAADTPKEAPSVTASEVTYESLWDDLRHRLKGGRPPNDPVKRAQYLAIRERIGPMIDNALEYSNVDDDDGEPDHRNAILDLIEELAYRHPFLGAAAPVAEIIPPVPAAAPPPAATIPVTPPAPPAPPAPVRPGIQLPTASEVSFFTRKSAVAPN